MEGKIGIYFGAISKPIIEQLIEQGVTMIPSKINLMQEMADSLTLLYLQQIITNTEVHKARRRLMKRIKKEMTDEK
jgi:hypothetical protein